MYSATISNVNVGATQSVFTLYANSSKMVALRAIALGQSTQTTQGSLRIRITYLPTTVTKGSGGSVANTAPWVSGDAANSANVRINDTTSATSNGTTANVWVDQWNLISGFTWIPPNFTFPILASTNEAIAVIIDTAPGSNIIINGSLVFEEVV